MTNKEFTDEAIIKALECCGNQMYVCTDKQCRAKTSGNAVDLIKSQKAEIERLKGSTIVSNIMESRRIKREAKIEAYNEFAKRLENEINIRTTLSREQDKNVIHMMNNLLKEMVSE